MIGLELLSEVRLAVSFKERTSGVSYQASEGPQFRQLRAD